MVAVQFVETAAALINFPVEVLLPLRLIIYNGNVRRKLVTGTETRMPQPLAEWLANASLLKGKIQIGEVGDDGAQ